MIGLRDVALGVMATLALAACSSPAPGPSPIPTPLQRVVKIDHANLPEGVVSYGTIRSTPAYGATVAGTPKLHAPEDVRLLEGAPADFREYLRGHIQEQERVVVANLTGEFLTVENADCDFIAEIRVWGAAPDVATGRERGCHQKSADVIWAKQEGVWTRVARMQGGWDCAVLQRYRVPADITGSTCWYDVFKTRPYDGPGR